MKKFIFACNLCKKEVTNQTGISFEITVDVIVPSNIETYEDHICTNCMKQIALLEKKLEQPV